MARQYIRTPATWFWISFNPQEQAGLRPAVVLTPPLTAQKLD
jgi:mRNA-degrading endonuclease toxin of MazEF toxin-antitoxin module